MNSTFERVNGSTRKWHKRKKNPFISVKFLGPMKMGNVKHDARFLFRLIKSSEITRDRSLRSTGWLQITTTWNISYIDITKQIHRSSLYVKGIYIYIYYNVMERALQEWLTANELIKKFPYFYGAEVSLLCSQESVNRLEPDESQSRSSFP